jgi:vacuolar-type H+-ATPase subunit H
LGLDLALYSIAEERRLHAKTCEELEAAHRKQLEVLQSTIEEERREVLKSQEIFEETLRLKYEAMVKALQDKASFSFRKHATGEMEQLRTNQPVSGDFGPEPGQRH